MLTIQILSKTARAVLCLNLTDEARRKGISIDTDELSLQLGIPVIETSARYKKGIDKLKCAVSDIIEDKIKAYCIPEIKSISESCTRSYEEKIELTSRIAHNIAEKSIGSVGEVYGSRDKRLDNVFTSKLTGVPIMLLIFALIFWLTAYGANYPSDLLSIGFTKLKDQLYTLFISINLNRTLISLLLDGIYTTTSWVVSVMLPPALIFFPLFSILEDSGYLPRVAFNLDRYFKWAGTSGKQALTMAMGFGCNACGVMGCRIIGSKKERSIAILTNSFIPCNGRLPTLIGIISIFFAGSLSGFTKSLVTTLILLAILIASVLMTLLVSFIISKASGHNKASSNFIMELPPYRRPQIIKSILLSIKDKVFFVLLRAVIVAVPAGAFIWFISNTTVYDTSLLEYITGFFEPFGKAVGVDGVIITAYLLGFPANEIVIPIILMSYLSSTTLTDYTSIAQLGELLTQNGWTLHTAICTLILCVFHFPCSTTCLTIKKETGSTLKTLLSIIIPLTVGILLCLIVTVIFRIFSL